MTNRTRRAAGALAVATILGGFGAGRATAGGDGRSVRYTTPGDRYPVIVVEGRRCLLAEDSIRLRVVDYDPGLVVYRCVVP
jgi:N-methylhydantoinase B/oxoprolinase/acetone carboxylase alpha subunit